MKSIMHDKNSGTCYLCMRLRSDYSAKPVRQEHHAVFGTANRRLSEKYGLKVYLCLNHHEEGKEAVHKNAETALIVKKAAQKAFEDRWPELDFRKIFGRNYVVDEDRKEEQRAAGGREGMEFIDGVNDLEWEGGKD